MGASSTTSTSNVSCKPVIVENLRRIRKTKTKKNNKQQSLSHTDDFIVKYAHNARDLELQIDITSVDTRRVVFVSLMGLFQTWNQCPPSVLYASLLIMPLKRIWLYDPLQHQEEIKSHIISEISLFTDMAETQSFLELLKWKDSQGLVCWMLDEHEYESNVSHINSVWHYVNEKLQSLYDPITSTCYKEINLKPKWWENTSQYISKYRVKTSTILAEFCNPSLKFKCIQEILYQSNPDSLFPVICYSLNDGLQGRESHIFSDADDETDDWWISHEYDPYDV